MWKQLYHGSKLKKSNVGKETVDNYYLSVMWEFKEDNLTDIYSDNLVGKNHIIINKESESYQIKDVTCVHENAFMDLYFMNDPFLICIIYYMRTKMIKINWRG